MILRNFDNILHKPYFKVGDLVQESVSIGKVGSGIPYLISEDSHNSSFVCISFEE